MYTSGGPIGGRCHTLFPFWTLQFYISDREICKPLLVGCLQADSRYPLLRSHYPHPPSCSPPQRPPSSSGVPVPDTPMLVMVAGTSSGVSVPDTPMLVVLAGIFVRCSGPGHTYAGEKSCPSTCKYCPAVASSQLRSLHLCNLSPLSLYCLSLTLCAFTVAALCSHADVVCTNI